MMFKQTLLIGFVFACALTLATAAPKSKKPVVKAALGDVSITDPDPYGVEASRATIDKTNKQLDLDFQANNLNKKSAATKAREDQNAQLRAANGVASLRSSKGDATATKTAKGQGNAVFKGKTATGTRDGNTLTGNTAQHKGDAKFTDTDVGRDGVLTGNGKVTNVGTNKDAKIYTADNTKVDAIVDAETQTKTEGKGQLGAAKQGEDKSFYLYEIARAADGESFNGQLEDLKDSPGRVRKQWKCTAEKAGESTCVDQNGKKVGKVLIDDQGNTVVYNARGLPIGRGTASKVGDGQYRVQVHKDANKKIGLFTAEVDNIKQSSCYQEVTGKREKKLKEVEIKSINFEYNSQRNGNGSKTISFPDCFDVVSEVKLAAGVLVEDLAVEFSANINPLGPLQCMSSATCGRKCYFCNLCEATSKNKDGSAGKIDVTDNIRTNACTAKGGRFFEMRTTVCPPPEDYKSAQCASFDRSLLNSGLLNAKRKSIEGRVLIWQRPKNEEALEKKYFAVMSANNRASDAVKKLLTAQYALKNNGQGWDSLTENERLNFYVRHYGREKLLSCKKGEVDYNLGGEKVDSDFLINVASTANQAKGSDGLSLFSDKPCDEWLAIQEAEYAAKQEAATAGKPSLLGSLLGAFGGRRRA